MREHEHAEVSRKLALAIGWDSPAIICGQCHVKTGDPISRVRIGRRGWIAGRWFDYRDPLVIWKIAERFDCFPIRCGQSSWKSYVRRDRFHDASDTAALAVARAVIAAKEKA